MCKTCAYVECDNVFSSNGKGHNKKFCCIECKAKHKTQYSKDYGRKLRDNTYTPKTIVSSIKRTIVKLTNPKPKVCGGCGETYLMKEAHEIYCIPCNQKLDKMRKTKYQKGEDDSHLHPQDI